MAECKPQAGFQEVHTDWCATHDVLLLACQLSSVKAERDKAERERNIREYANGFSRAMTMVGNSPGEFSDGLMTALKAELTRLRKMEVAIHPKAEKPHEWVMVQCHAYYGACSVCGIMRRADDTNKPCPGKAPRITTRKPCPTHAMPGVPHEKGCQNAKDTEAGT